MTNKSDKILAPIKSRVIQFIENQNIEKKFFFEKLGVASSNFRGNALYSEISADVIAKILSQYPYADSEWLLTGKGSMLKDDAKGSISQKAKGNNNTQIGSGSATITRNKGHSSEPEKNKVHELEKLLNEKNQELEGLKTLLSEKDAFIFELQKQVFDYMQKLMSTK